MEKFAKVETEYGAVKGVRKSTVLGVEYYSFQGIPYMKAPVGKLRFRDAEPPENWTEFDATGECSSYVSKHMLTNEPMGQEDAATINVFTKDVQPSKLYPVMVWIHGGGFFTGSSSTDVYGPDYILQRNVILVSFNYRYGVLGFLSLKDPSLGVPGNAGLKDQAFALKWVQRNIAKFGGDKDNVTIFGESAGGASVHWHMLSDHSKGLFKRAIPMSGVSLHCWSVTPDRNHVQKLAAVLGYDGSEDDESILSFLETIDVNKINEASGKVATFQERAFEKIMAFHPCIEPYVSDNCFIPKHPREMSRTAWSNAFDCLIGGTSNEGLLMGLKCVNPTGDYSAALAMQNPNFFVPAFDLGLSPDDPKIAEYGHALKELYYGSTTPSKTNLESYFYYCADQFFWHGIQKAVLSRASFFENSASVRKGKTYVYRFDVITDLNFVKKDSKNEKYPGSEHTADIFHLFKGNFAPIPSINSKEFENVKKTVAIWTNFAITGNPNCPEIGDDEWIPVESTNLPLKCLNIGTDKCKFIELPETERLNVWNSIYKQAGAVLY